MADFPDSGSLRSINEADVYKAGALAGHLRRLGDVVEFSYVDSYLAESAAPPVAFTLPESAGKYRATGGSVPPFFAGLLPDGLRLSAITTAVRTSEDDHLSLLLAVGRDAIGDVQVVPAGFDRADTSDADFGSLFAQVTATNADEFDRTGLPGVHGKNLSIRQNPAGLWEVTPAYDLLTTQPYLSWNDPMALPLYGRDGKLIYRWWVEAARRLEVSERAIKRSLARIVDSSEPWIDRVSDIGFDEKTTRRLSRLIAPPIATILAISRSLCDARHKNGRYRFQGNDKTAQIW